MKEFDRALFDTNILIEYLAANQNAIDCINACKELLISKITVMEVLSWPGFLTDLDGLHRAGELIELFEILDIEPYIELATEIRRSKGGKLPDVIIHATALLNKLPIITHNLDDFHDVAIPDVENVLIHDPY